VPPSPDLLGSVHAPRILAPLTIWVKGCDEPSGELACAKRISHIFRIHFLCDTKGPSIDVGLLRPFSVTTPVRRPRSTGPPPLPILLVFHSLRPKPLYSIVVTSSLSGHSGIESSMGFHSPASTPSPEAWESDSQDEHGFGHPLRRMVPMENVHLGHEESPLGSFRAGLYKMPASQSSSTSSHMFFV